MSVARINEFQAKAGQGDLLRETLAGFDPIFKEMAGFQSHQILQSIDEPEQIVVIEVWESVGAHQAAVRQIPVNAFEKTMQLLAAPPQGAYYR